MIADLTGMEFANLVQHQITPRENVDFIIYWKSVPAVHSTRNARRNTADTQMKVTLDAVKKEWQASN